MGAPQACTAHLSCPVCAEPLADAGASARCAAGHSFDYARSGYLNLTAGGGRGRVGDTAAMVRARAEFLAGGHYEPIAEALRTVAGEIAVAASVVAEIGCGTGYYLDALASGRGDGEAGCGFGFDLSKAAAAQASRRHPGLRFAVADVEVAIPLCDGAADLALSAFAPRPGPELGRVVRPGGTLIVAFAASRHLRRLRERLGLIGIHEDKLELLRERLEPWFDLESTHPVEYEIELAEPDAQRLVTMGPNAWHQGGAAALGGGLTDLVSVVVAGFRRSDR
jgi:23S rRNA (guanine745-N1)-methyltransferase